MPTPARKSCAKIEEIEKPAAFAPFNLVINVISLAHLNSLYSRFNMPSGITDLKLYRHKKLPWCAKDVFLALESAMVHCAFKE